MIALFAVARITATADGFSISALAMALAEHNLIYILTYAALIGRALQISKPSLATRQDLWVCLAVAALLAGISLFDISALDGPVALLFGLYLVLSARPQDNCSRAVGVIFVAVGCHLFIGKLLLMVFQSQIVAVDAFIVQHTLWLTGDAAPRVANRVTSESGFAIAVVGGCSAFNNITLLILAMVAGIMWVRPRFQRRDLWWFAMGVALVLMLNTIRLGLMAQSYDSYVYWHNGAGAQYISIMQTVLVLAVAFVAAQGGGARKPPSEAAA